MSDSSNATAMEPFAVTIDQARQLLGNKGRNGIYDALKKGDLEAVRDNKRTLILMASIKNYLTSLQPVKFDDNQRVARMKQLRARHRKKAAASASRPS
jgi:hypothetical protein